MELDKVLGVIIVNILELGLCVYYGRTVWSVGLCVDMLFELYALLLDMPIRVACLVMRCEPFYIDECLQMLSFPFFLFAVIIRVFF